MKQGESRVKLKKRKIRYVVPLFVMFVCAACFWKTVKIQADTNKNAEKSTKMQSGTSEISQKLTVVLDPGHGGSQSGAARDNEQIEEKALNLKIAKYLKKELEAYENVKVFLTRTADKDVELPERTQFALDKKADVMISLHNNAAGKCAAYDHGCTVLAAKYGYKDMLALEEQKLSCNILNELSKLGIENQGILLRDSEANEHYSNGILSDYYAIIRGGVLNNIPTVLIEHAFIDNDSDYENYLSTDKKLKQLAIADATGIARYYQLVKKNTGNYLPENKEVKCELEPLENYKVKLVHAIDGNGKHNKISYRTYYNKNYDSDDTSNDTDKKAQQDMEVFQRINESINQSMFTDLNSRMP